MRIKYPHLHPRTRNAVRRAMLKRRFKPVWRLKRKRKMLRPTRMALHRAWAIRRWGRLFDPECPF